MPAPVHPKIYHITHVRNLAGIIGEGGLLSDSTMTARGDQQAAIGLPAIKQRRLRSPVKCRDAIRVGDCVPFYFCPRSVMLFKIFKGNDPELPFKEGQGSIVHLEADLRETIAWAETEQRPWAFTFSNAGSNYFEDCCDVDRLPEINWVAVAARRWSGPGISRDLLEGKQAEFLIHQSFPWGLVDRIGVHSRAVAQAAAEAMQGADHRPVVEIKRDWYY